MPTQPAPDNQTCPLCGNNNACAMASNKQAPADCWCMTTDIDPDALARVPDALVNRVCLCQACAKAPRKGSGN